ncbi:hypothetical protein BD311DRAFT_770136, partial [Dichomitus squalens]
MYATLLVSVQRNRTMSVTTVARPRLRTYPGICAHTRTYRHLRLGGRSVRGEAYHVASNQRL